MAVNTIRFSGLASGLDTESIVKSMVAPYKMKADVKKQEQTMMEWRKEAWKDMNAKMFSFYDKQVNKMRMEGTFNKSKVTTSDENIVKLDPNASLPAGTHELTVNNLATGTRLETESIKTAKGGKVTNSTGLSELGITFTNKDTKIPITIIANEKPATIDLTSNMTIGGVVEELKKVMPEYNVNFDEGMGALFISSKNTGAKQKIEIEKTSENEKALEALGIKIDNTQQKQVLKGTGDEVIGYVSEEVIDASKITNIINITGNVREIKDNQGKLIGYLKDNGNQGTMYPDAVGIDGNPLKDKTGSALKSGEVTVVMGTKAVNSEVIYNGVKANFESNSISINGLSMTLKSASPVDPAYTDNRKKATTLVSTKDTEASFNAIKEFAEEYNKLIDEMNKKVAAPSARDYKPLTEEQKKDMGDKEVEAWEKKIKDSLFRGDESMKQLTSTMREIMGSVVQVPGTDKGLTLSQIGITTGNWKDYGKLTIDETKLKQALADNPEDVAKLFSSGGDAKSLYEADKTNYTVEWDKLPAPDKKKYQDQIGIGDRLYNSLTEMTLSSELRSKYSFYNDKSLTKEIVEVKDDYSKLIERMERMEDMHYKKMAAMEKMMSSLNNQSSWLTQQLSGGQ